MTNRERERVGERTGDNSRERGAKKRVTTREREGARERVTEQGQGKDGTAVGVITIRGLHQGEGIGRKVGSKEEQQVEKENQGNEEGSMRRVLGIT